MIHLPAWITCTVAVVDVVLALNIVRIFYKVRQEHKQWVKDFEFRVEMSVIEHTLRGDDPVCIQCGHTAEEHAGRDGICLHTDDVGDSQFQEFKECDCPRFYT